MSFYWVDNGDGTSTVFLQEVAPSVDPHAREKYQTWFIRNLQPDGICMNCRKRPGLLDPIGGYYSCEECRRQCEATMALLVADRAA